MSKEELVAAVKKCAEELGRVPTFSDFRSHTRISPRQVRINFGTYTRLLFESGLERGGPGCVVSLKALFEDWGKVVRRLGKIPTMADYDLEGRYSVRPLLRRFKTWSQMPAGLLQYARHEGLGEEWQDVLKIIENRQKVSEDAARTSAAGIHPPVDWRMVTDNQPVFGPPMHAPLMCAPINEQGVLFAFGSVARELGFAMLQVQTAFPDCIGLRHIGGGRWRWVKIELEYESRNFLTHMHSSAGCDLIVCWRHNWPECPVEVIELQNVAEIWKRPL
jgi:hypothetical protein